MSVIGRLDDQVEAVLINPLKRRERPADDGDERGQLPLPPAASREEREETAPGERREEEDDDATLPVWML